MPEAGGVLHLRVRRHSAALMPAVLGGVASLLEDPRAVGWDPWGGSGAVHRGEELPLLIRCHGAQSATAVSRRSRGVRAASGPTARRTSLRDCVRGMARHGSCHDHAHPVRSNAHPPHSARLRRCPRLRSHRRSTPRTGSLLGCGRQGGKRFIAPAADH